MKLSFTRFLQSTLSVLWIPSFGFCVLSWHITGSLHPIGAGTAAAQSSIYGSALLVLGWRCRQRLRDYLKALKADDDGAEVVPIAPNPLHPPIKKTPATSTPVGSNTSFILGYQSMLSLIAILGADVLLIVLELIQSVYNPVPFEVVKVVLNLVKLTGLLALVRSITYGDWKESGWCSILSLAWVVAVMVGPDL